MNKGYLDQMSKARMLSEGVSVHMSELVKKNIKIDTRKLDELTKELEDAAKKQDEAESSLLSARQNAYKLLDDLKQELLSVKIPIKSAFLSDEWSKFGITDKR